MFGYVSANPKLMTEEEVKRYRSVYCGLCRTIGGRYGQLCRLSLTYDMTFLALFLNAMYEPDEQTAEFWCPVHPKGKRTSIHTKYLQYAADLNVLLAYWNCLDNWEDERSVMGLAESLVFKKGYRKVSELYPRQANTIHVELHNLSQLETANCDNPDLPANCFGRLLGDLFVYDESDYFAEDLRSFGFYLGKFIYLYDACMDYDTDKKRGRYNPLLLRFPDGLTEETVRQILTVYISSCVDIYERLPIIQDNVIIKNILYSGVWQCFEKKFGHRKNGSSE